MQAELDALDAARRNANTSEATISMLAKRADAAVERLRKISDSRASAEKERGQLVHIDDLRAELGPILIAITRNLSHKIFTYYGGEIAKAERLVDESFREMRACRFCAAAPNTTAAA